MEAADRLTGGELNAALTKTLVGIQTEHLDRGPARAVAFHRDNVVVAVMHGVLTKAENVGHRTGITTTSAKLAACSGTGWKTTSAPRSSA